MKIFLTEKDISIMVSECVTLLSEGILTDLLLGSDIGDSQTEQPLDNNETNAVSDIQQPQQATMVSGNIDERAAYVIKRLMSDLDIPKHSAAAMCGMIHYESRFNPAAVNQGEKNGTFRASAVCAHKPGTKEPYDAAYSYGAGLIQWSFWNRKLKVVRSIGKDEQFLMTQGIESLSMDDQITMIENELKSSSYCNVLSGLKSAPNVEYATKLLYSNFIGGYRNSATFTDKQVADTTARYTRTNNTTRGHADDRTTRAAYFEKLE